MFSKEDRRLIEAVEFKRQKLISCFCETPATLDLYTTGSADRKPGTGRRRTARTDDNVKRVEDHLKERLIEDWSRFDQNISQTSESVT